jgi:hypothetical protein
LLEEILMLQGRVAGGALANMCTLPVLCFSLIPLCFCMIPCMIMGAIPGLCSLVPCMLAGACPGACIYLGPGLFCCTLGGVFLGACPGVCMFILGYVCCICSCGLGCLPCGVPSVCSFVSCMLLGASPGCFCVELPSLFCGVVPGMLIGACPGACCSLSGAVLGASPGCCLILPPSACCAMFAQTPAALTSSCPCMSMAVPATQAINQSPATQQVIQICPIMSAPAPIQM